VLAMPLDYRLLVVFGYNHVSFRLIPVNG
jgi:hypothetical protein